MNMMSTASSGSFTTVNRLQQSLLVIVQVWIMTASPVWSQDSPVWSQDSPVAACPPAVGAVCSCLNRNNEFIIDCANRQPRLMQVPSSKSENASVLNLSNNSIERIQRYDFICLESLRTLFLQFNKISIIEPGSFDNLYSLQLLVLSSNSLSYVLDTYFQHLPHLQSLDLSNNHIIKIQKKPFLTLPASNSSTVTISLDGNQIYCDCDALAMRNWSQLLSNSLAKISLQGFICYNVQNITLDSLPDSLRDVFPCNSSELAMFEAGNGRSCITCQGQTTQQTCDTTSTLCADDSQVCRSEVSVWNNQVFVNKACAAYTDCLLLERQNPVQCRLTHAEPTSNIRCTFCCTGRNCNEGDMGGRTNSFQLYVALRVTSQTFQTFMLDNSSDLYRDEAERYKENLSGMFQELAGSYVVEFLSFRNDSGFPSAACSVSTTHLNTYNVDRVVNIMAERLNQSAKSGFLDELKVTFIYVGTEMPGKCKKEVTQTEIGTVSWPDTLIGSISTVNCPSENSDAKATRQCWADANYVGIWGVPSVDACWQRQTLTTVTGMPDQTLTTVPGMPDQTLTTVPGMPNQTRTTVTGMPDHNLTTVPGMPNQTLTTVPGMPNQTFTTVPGMPNQTLTTVPGMPNQTFTTVPGMPNQTLTTVPGMPNQTFTTVPGMPNQTLTTVPGMPNQTFTTVPGMPNQTLTTVPGMPNQSSSPAIIRDKCLKDESETDVGSITWPDTFAGDVSRQDCPPGTLGIGVWRQCVLVAGEAKWESPNVSSCRLEESDVTPELTVLNNTVITQDNVNDVVDQLQKLSVNGSQLTVVDVNLIMDTMERILAPSHTLTNMAALNSSVKVLSNLIDANSLVLKEANRMKKSARRLFELGEKIAREGQLTDGRLLLSGANLVAAAQAVGQDDFQGLTLSAADGDVTVQSSVLNESANQGSSLILPPSLLTTALTSRIAMTVHWTGKLFEAMASHNTSTSTEGTEDPRIVSRINSCVMAASLVGHNVINLEDPIAFTLTHFNTSWTNPRCMFWDVVQLQWSSQGCRLVANLSTDNSTTCHCDHLTNFALLMDVYGDAGSLSSTDRKVLSIISYIGCGLSLLALLLTLLTYCFFKKLRRDNPSKILINLCVALALSNLIFIAGMQPYALSSSVGCKVVAVLLHFSLLSSMCWMAVEAFYMYLALILVFKTYYTNFILKCSLVGWGVPLVIVIITLAVNKTENYGSLTSGICWLRGIAFYAAFVGPVCLILFINILAFALVLHQILGLSRRNLNKSDSFTASQQLRGAVGVAILLGLTWIFAIFAIDRASTAFYYLFAIFNSLQGLWIFLFYCLLKKEARSAWKRVLPCFERLEEKSVVVTTSKAGYSIGANTHQAATKSTAKEPTTVSTSVSKPQSQDNSEVSYVNGGSRSSVSENSDPDNDVGAVDMQPQHIYVNEYPADTERGGGEGPLPSHTPSNRTVTTSPTRESEGTTSSPRVAPRPLQFLPGKTLAEATKRDNSLVVEGHLSDSHMLTFKPGHSQSVSSEEGDNSREVWDTNIEGTRL